MKLTIVITHYKEPFEVVRPLLESIALQKGIAFKDVEVQLVNDGNEVTFGAHVADNLPYPIYYTVLDKCGVSACRNKGLELANGDYVMFCDCDDRFTNLLGLHLVFQAMEERFDAISSAFLEEHVDKDGWSMIRREEECTFVHGKVYSKRYLDRIGLKFNEELTIHEDGFFNCLALVLTQNKHYIKTPFYMWCFREGSVADRADDEFKIKTYGHLLKMKNALLDELKKRGETDIYYQNLAKTVCDAYYDLMSKDWIKSQYHAQAEADFTKFYKIWKKEIALVPVATFEKFLTICRNEHTGRIGVEDYTLKDYLRRISKGKAI